MRLAYRAAERGFILFATVGPAEHIEVVMRCARCGASMLKTELYVSPELRKLTTVNASRYDRCGRIEYYPVQSIQRAA
jgi:hypothetical protein